MKLSKCPAKEQKGGKKIKRRGEERNQKDKVKTAVSFLNLKSPNLISVHAQKLQANILQLEITILEGCKMYKH